MIISRVILSHVIDIVNFHYFPLIRLWDKILNFMRLNFTIITNVHKSISEFQNFMNELKVYSDPIRAVPFHIAATRGIVSHAVRAAPCHYPCHGTTLSFSRISTFIPVCLCVFALNAMHFRWTQLNVLQLRWATVMALNIRPCTPQERQEHSMSFPEDTADYIYFICSLRTARGECHCEWNRNVVAVGTAVKCANNWFLYVDNYASRLLIESNNRVTKYNFTRKKQ